MKPDEIIFWSMIAIALITFVVIFSALLKEFKKLLKKAEKRGEEIQKLRTDNYGNKPKTFREVIIEPSSDSDIFDLLKEMKLLSAFIKMPVCAEFNNKELRITPTTDIDKTVHCFRCNIDTDSVRSK